MLPEIIELCDENICYFTSLFHTWKTLRFTFRRISGTCDICRALRVTLGKRTTITLDYLLCLFVLFSFYFLDLLLFQRPIIHDLLLVLTIVHCRRNSSGCNSGHDSRQNSGSGHCCRCSQCQTSECSKSIDSNLKKIILSQFQCQFKSLNDQKDPKNSKYFLITCPVFFLIL